jgi:Cu2+-exporting ATPase
MSATYATLRGIAARQCAHCRLPLPARPHVETEGDETLQFCCLGCVLVYRVVGNAGEGGRADWFLAKLALAALLSGNVMMFQSMTYFGTLDALGPEVLRTSSWIMFCCSLAVFALLGLPMLRIAIRELLRGHLGLESLIGFGAMAAIGFSSLQTLRGRRDLYYDSGTMVLVFVVLGQYMDAEARRRALALLAPTVSRLRRKARVFRDGTEVQIAPGSVQAAEIVYVRAGEEVPVDGQIVAGCADVSEPLLTGEWRPRSAVVGDRLNAGATALDGALAVRASGDADTLADRIEHFALEARDRRAPIEAAVDRVVAVFVPAVLVIAVATFCFWTAAGDWQYGLQAAIAVLVVACPCALGIATPMATSIACSIAMGRGVLVKGGAVLETLSRIEVIGFDKTGTVTLGCPQVVECHASPGATMVMAASLRLAAAVEAEVDHPFARAMVAALVSQGQTPPAATDVRAIAGGGASGRVENRQVNVGKLSWMKSCGIEIPKSSRYENGPSTVGIAIDGCLVGEVVFDDPCRPEALETMQTLGQMGISCHLLSGDCREAVARVAKAAGFKDFAANLSPTDKPLHVRALRTPSKQVAMVGDGVNDAPALGAAHAGIAFGVAADLAKQSADVIVLNHDLREIPRLLTLARKTLRIVRQNLVWAFAYNAMAIAIAACGLLRPIVAAAAMVLSSLCVVHNSMRINRSQRNNLNGSSRQ